GRRNARRRRPARFWLAARSHSTRWRRPFFQLRGFSFFTVSLFHCHLLRTLRQHSGRRDSARQSAAVDRDQFAVDMVGRIGGEEHRERTEFAVLADAADGNKLAALE